MAYSKFITGISLLICNFLSASPNTELFEMRETQRMSRAESPRKISSPAKPQVVIPRQNEESICWSFLSCFCSLMEYAGNSSPHPVIRITEQRRVT